MSDMGFLVESVTAALMGLLVSDAYTSARPRLSAILGRSRSDDAVRIEDLDRLRRSDPTALHSAVYGYVHQLAVSDERLARQLQDALREPQPHTQLNVHDNQFHGPTQVGGTQIVNMRAVEYDSGL